MSHFHSTATIKDNKLEATVIKNNFQNFTTNFEFRQLAPPVQLYPQIAPLFAYFDWSLKKACQRSAQ
jgi:hypothetical protein